MALTHKENHKFQIDSLVNMNQSNSEGETSQNAERAYFDVLLRQYSECWASIRNYTNSIWQIPTFLIAVISFLGLLYSNYLRDVQIGRILTLFLAFGFALVSIIALKKHRFFSVCRTKDFEEIQEQLKKFLEQKEFRFKEIKFKSADLAKDGCYLHRTSAYRWQLGLAIIILIGISILLIGEFVLLLVPYI